MEKVILISVDGMRPNGFLSCGNSFAGKMMRLGSYTLEGHTVYGASEWEGKSVA